jgi:GntR family transcriptional regulator, rspAB operon transcriptional repressor
MTLSEIEKPQLKDLAYEHLKAAIVRLDLPPGRPLRETDIAKQMGMSKTPVREAFVRLASDGLVDITAYRGAVVRGYDATDLREIFELREVVEGFAARQAATGLTDSIRSLLEQNVKDSRLAVLVNDRDKLSYLVSEFDRIVYDQTKNSRVRRLLDQLRCHIDRIGKLSEHIPGRLAQSVEQHTRIVEAILAADPDEAERRMRSHIRSVMDAQLQVLREDDAVS